MGSGLKQSCFPGGAARVDRFLLAFGRILNQSRQDGFDQMGAWSLGRPCRLLRAQAPPSRRYSDRSRSAGGLPRESPPSIFFDDAKEGAPPRLDRARAGRPHSRRAKADSSGKPTAAPFLQGGAPLVTHQARWIPSKWLAFSLLWSLGPRLRPFAFRCQAALVIIPTRRRLAVVRSPKKQEAPARETTHPSASPKPSIQADAPMGRLERGQSSAQTRDLADPKGALAALGMFCPKKGEGPTILRPQRGVPSPSTRLNQPRTGVGSSPGGRP